jgi:hypothetical protein
MVPGYPQQQQSPQLSKRPEPRRSAFTIQSLSEKESHGHMQNSPGRNPPVSSTASTSPASNYPSSVRTMDTNTERSNQNDSQHPPSSLIPVIYAASNKKRKKIPSDSEMAVPIPPRSNDQSYQKNSHQQINSVVRTYYEVDKDRNGIYILPVEIDSWTVVELGTVVYDRPAYHNQRYIYPINYTVRK